MQEIGSVLGFFFAARVAPDSEWAKSLVRGGEPNGSAMEL